jgi:AcrR family transcriptional regulator
MTRKKGQSDQRLLAAAQALLDENGFAGLKIRQVAAKAKVNLGMFHYHFKTKDEFARRVLEDVYERFFRNFSLESGSEGTPLERLRRSLNLAGRFVRDNRRMFLGMLSDTLQGNKIAARFVKENFPRHVMILIGLIRQCQEEELLDKNTLPNILPTLMASIMGPSMIVTLLDRVEAKTLFGVAIKLFQGQVLSDEAIAQRVEIVLKGLGAPARSVA